MAGFLIFMRLQRPPPGTLPLRLRRYTFATKQTHLSTSCLQRHMHGIFRSPAKPPPGVGDALAVSKEPPSDGAREAPHPCAKARA
jgi:hypothetical protein